MRPLDWQDLLKDDWSYLAVNYNTAGTAKLVINTMIQKYGHDEGIQYLVTSTRTFRFTLSPARPSKNVGTGECVIGIGFLHDGITQIVDNGYDNIELIIPSSEPPSRSALPLSSRAALTPMLQSSGLSTLCLPDCVNLAKDNGSYQFLVIDNAEQPSQAADFGLDPRQRHGL